MRVTLAYVPLGSAPPVAGVSQLDPMHIVLWVNEDVSPRGEITVEEWERAGDR